ncbi:MAG: hypothetical protein ACRYGB_04605 [Janthinobacterium lividum]
MARKLAETSNSYIVSLLNKLTNKDTNSEHYANIMYELGKEFGQILIKKIQTEIHTISLASTVEDADSLGKGIIEVLESHGKNVLLTVFWNKRYKPNDNNGISIAPILREFHQPGYKEAPLLIIIKSIIANSCVVRTNLTKLISESNPVKVFVVAPVLLKDAPQKLESEFEDSISAKFDYLYFAEDDEKDENGNVQPGIGGDVYKRLGFEGQDAKNKYVPEIVKKRRNYVSNYSNTLSL